MNINGLTIQCVNLPYQIHPKNTHILICKTDDIPTINFLSLIIKISTLAKVNIILIITILTNLSTNKLPTFNTNPANSIEVIIFASTCTLSNQECNPNNGNLQSTIILQITDIDPHPIPLRREKARTKFMMIK